MPATLEPEKILKDLRNLWHDLGRDAEVSGGVLRACGMTLVVAAENDPNNEELRHTLGVLMHDHPAAPTVYVYTTDGGRLRITAPLPPHMSKTWKFLGFNADAKADFPKRNVEKPEPTREIARQTKEAAKRFHSKKPGRAQRRKK